MKLCHSISITALASLFLVSCYPVNENPNRNSRTKKQDKTAPAAAAEQKKVKDAEESKKKEVVKKEPEIKDTTETAPVENPVTSKPEPTETKKEEPKKTSEYSFASKIPGKDGFVLSPYNNKVVDVRDIASGTLVQDPTYPASEKKYFRVP